MPSAATCSTSAKRAKPLFYWTGRLWLCGWRRRTAACYSLPYTHLQPHLPALHATLPSSLPLHLPFTTGLLCALCSLRFALSAACCLPSCLCLHACMLPQAFIAHASCANACLAAAHFLHASIDTFALSRMTLTNSCKQRILHAAAFTAILAAAGGCIFMSTSAVRDFSCLLRGNRALYGKAGCRLFALPSVSSCCGACAGRNVVTMRLRRYLACARRWRLRRWGGVFFRGGSFRLRAAPTCVLSAAAVAAGPGSTTLRRTACAPHLQRHSFPCCLYMSRCLLQDGKNGRVPSAAWRAPW